MKKVTIISILQLFVFGIAYSQSTWADIAKDKSIKEVEQSKKILISTAHNLSYIEQLTAIESIDIEKTIANNRIIESISPNTQIFSGQSFVDVMNQKVKDNFNMNSKLGKEALAAGLDNATKSNGLLTSLVNVHPIGAAVGNVLSVINGFLEKKGVFLFIKKLFAPNYEAQIKKFTDDLSPYLSFYNQMDIQIRNSKETFETYNKILSPDAKKLEDLFGQYKAARDKLTNRANSTTSDVVAYVNDINTSNMTAEEYLSFSANEKLQELIAISKQIKDTEINMSYNYLSFNKDALRHINAWMNELKNNPLTSGNKSEQLKIIISDLENATSKMNENIAKLEKIIEERKKDVNNLLGEEILKMRLNVSFFAPDEEFKNKIKSSNPSIEPFLKN